MKKRIVNSLILGAATFGIAASANAAGVVINFGNTNPGATVNNYVTPPTGDYANTVVDFTTSLTGTTGVTGTNYNTVQVFKDLSGVAVTTTLDLKRTGNNGKMFPNNTGSFGNVAAISDMTATVGAFDTSTLSGANTIITPGAGGSLFSTITLNNLGNTAGANATFYFAVSSANAAFSTISVAGGTTTSLEFAGTGGSGFVGTLADAAPATGQLTIVKWTGSLTAANASVALTMNGDKSGVSTVAYVIPEPSSMALLGLSALGLVARRRRQA